MIDSAGKRSARPSAEISQRLTHIIDGFPGVSLPMLPLICIVFLKSSYVHMAISHPPCLVHTVTFGITESAANPQGQLLATSATEPGCALGPLGPAHTPNSKPGPQFPFLFHFSFPPWLVHLSS